MTAVCPGGRYVGHRRYRERGESGAGAHEALERPQLLNVRALNYVELCDRAAVSAGSRLVGPFKLDDWNPSKPPTPTKPRVPRRRIATTAVQRPSGPS